MNISLLWIFIALVGISGGIVAVSRIRNAAVALVCLVVLSVITSMVARYTNDQLSQVSQFFGYWDSLVGSGAVAFGVFALGHITRRAAMQPVQVDTATAMHNFQSVVSGFDAKRQRRGALRSQVKYAVEAERV